MANFSGDPGPENPKRQEITEIIDVLRERGQDDIADRLGGFMHPVNIMQEFDVEYSGLGMSLALRDIEIRDNVGELMVIEATFYSLRRWPEYRDHFTNLAAKVSENLVAGKET